MKEEDCQVMNLNQNEIMKVVEKEQKNESW